MKSETKPSTKNASDEPSASKKRGFGKSAKQPVVGDKAMSRLERIRLVVLFVVLLGLIFYAWRHHQWNTDVRDITYLLSNEDAVTAIEKIRTLERDWGRSGESSFLKARAYRYLESVDQCARFISEARVAGYSPERLDHEELLLDVQCIAFEISEQSARRVLTSYQADMDENGVALIRGLLRTDDTEGANIMLTIWSQALKDTSLETARLSYATGLTAEKIGQFEKAKDEFEKSYNENPDYIPLWLKLANTYWRDNDAEKAYGLFNQYYEKRPDDPIGEGGRIEAMLAMGDYQKIVDYFKSYSSPLDTSGRGRLFLAQAYEGLEQYPELIATLEPVIRDWPQDIVANQLLAVAYQAVEQSDNANKCAEQARKSVEEQAKITELRRQLSENFLNAKLHQELGSILLKLISRAEGVSELKIALRLDPKDKLAHEDLAKFYDVMGDSEQAAKHRQAVEAKQ